MKVLAVTHGASVGPGVFGDAIRAAGHELDEWCVPLGGDPPAAADALLVLGGAMHPDQDERHPWLGRELRFLEHALERRTPVLGVCLGAQLLARAAGAPVREADEPEIGWFDVELTPAATGDAVIGALPERFEAFQWHRYTYDLPAGAEELARSRACTQAFRLGRAYGIQFHAEVTAGQIEQWLGEDADDVEDAAALRAATRPRIGGWNELGRRLCSAFLAAA